jgi:hypothetical protein
MSYTRLKVLALSAEYHHIKHSTRWSDFKSVDDIRKILHEDNIELTSNEEALLNNIIRNQEWSIADDLR